MTAPPWPRRAARRLLAGTVGITLTLAPTVAGAATRGHATVTPSGSSASRPVPVPTPGWSQTVGIGRVAATDMLAPVPAVSPSGGLAIGGGTTNEDAQDSAAATVAQAVLGGGRRSAAGPRFTAPRTLPATQQVLAAAFAGSRLVLVTGTSPPRSGLACCTSAAVVDIPSGAGRASSRTLTEAITGPVHAELVPVRGGLIAVVSAQTGIWVARIGNDGRPGPAVRLTGSTGALVPASAAAAPLASGGAIVAWATPVPYGLMGTTGEAIRFAVSGPRGLPAVPQTAIVLPAGDTVGSIAVAAHRGTATILLTQTRTAGAGQTVAQVLAVDIGPRGSTVRSISSSSSFAAAVSLADAPDGRQVASWQQCAAQGTTCTAEVDVRPHGNGWIAPGRLGAIDPQAFPVLAVDPAGAAAGTAVVAWVLHGDLVARVTTAHATGFGQAHTLSASGSAQQPALAFGAAGTALATWVDGTAAQRVRAATFTAN